MRRGAASLLLFLAALAFAATAAIVLTGGFAVRAIGLTLRDPMRPLVLGLALLAAARLVAGPMFAPLAQRAFGSPERLPARVAVLLSVCVLVFTLAWTSRAAGGSDSSCYVLQAEAFANGHATLESRVARALPDAPNAVFAPAGFRPSVRDHGSAVPICAPGLSLVMAVAYLVHPSAVFVVVPICAALLVWLTFVYGRRIDGAMTGVCAAVLLACSPIFLYQAVQPMSDVPAAAAWMAALVSASPIAAGAWASLAVLIRPNLVLLLLPLALLTRATVLPPEGGSYRDERRGFRLQAEGLFPFLAAAVPAGAVLLALNLARYGGVFASGYGDAGTLFALDRVGQNLARYPVWLLETQTPLVLLAIAAPWVLRRDPARARIAWISLAAVALLVLTYLIYTVFDDWWYIRFLLPALPILLVLSVTVLRALIDRIPALAAGLTIAVMTAPFALYYVQVARARHVTDLQRFESRFVLAGEYAARHLPANAVVLAVQQSGSILFHGRRDTVVWDAIAPDALDATIVALRDAGRPVYLALEDAEEPEFRRRFAGQRAGALDWRPIVELRAPARVRFYAAETTR